MKIVLFWAILITAIFADRYSETLLQMHAKVLPSIVLMDKDIAQKSKNHAISFVVLYERNDKIYAEIFKNLLQESYKNRLKEYKIKVTISEYSELDSIQNANAIYLLFASDKNIQKASEFAIVRKIVSFSYDADYVKKGVLSSLVVDKESLPILNIKTLQRSKIEFDPTLIGISKRHIDE